MEPGTNFQTTFHAEILDKRVSFVILQTGQVSFPDFVYFSSYLIECKSWYFMTSSNLIF